MRHAYRFSFLGKVVNRVCWTLTAAAVLDSLSGMTAAGLTPPEKSPQLLARLERELKYGIVQSADLEQLEQYVEDYPQDPQGHFLLAVYCEKQQLITQAREEYKLAGRMAQANTKSALQLFKLAIKLDYMNAAIALLPKVQAAYPHDPYVLYLKGVSLVASGKMAEGEQLLQKAARQGEGVAGLPSALGMLALGRRQFQTALAWADADLAIEPDSYRGNMLKAGILTTLGSCQGAVIPLKQLYMQTPLRAGIAQALSLCFLRNGQVNEALEPTLTCLALQNHDAIDRLLKILKVVPMADFHQTIALMTPRFTVRGLGAEFHFGLGETFDRLGNYRQAIEQYQLSLEQAPKYAIANFNLGKDLEMYTHDYPQALRCYQLACENSPDNPEYVRRYKRLQQRLSVRRQDLAWQLRDWLTGSNSL